MAPSTTSDYDAIETLIFVDVDGVVNLAIKDDGQAGILLSDTSLKDVYKYWESFKEDAAMQRFVAVANRDVGNCEPGVTNSKFACKMPAMFSITLVDRLARLIQAAGDRQKCEVVLSSSWRRSENSKARRRLEEELGRKLGSPFSFHSTTGMQEDQGAGDRLGLIGDFVADFCSKRSPQAAKLKALILEDFFTTPLQGWKCDSVKINSAQDCEDYVAGRARAMADSRDLSVKLIHPYSAWNTESGLEIQFSTGLTMDHYEAALAFLSNSDLKLGAQRARLPPSMKRASYTYPPRAFQCFCGATARSLGGLMGRLRDRLFFFWPGSRGKSS